MTTQITFDFLTSIIALTGSYLAYKEFKKSKRLNEIDKFISYREKLRTDTSLIKIITHIQLWQHNQELKNQIPEDISLFDFYNFISFFEEINILITKSHLNKKTAKDMFAFYAIQIANNSHYWEYFGENYQNDDDWKNFRLLVEKMR